MDEKRLVGIEEKLAHQEVALDEVSRVLSAQQAQLDRLDRACRSLAEKFRSFGESRPGQPGGDERPPHF